MNIRIITASAGSGKTTRLSELLEQAIGASKARPEGILATTFTKQAAAELLNRARTRLLRTGNGTAAQRLLTARIGTVNSVCGSLVSDFAFELGLSPELRVLDEEDANIELRRALASAVSEEMSDGLQAFREKFDRQFDWHYEVRRVIEAARANGIDADGLTASADRSVSSLDECLGPITETPALDADLCAAIDQALEQIERNGDATKTTRDYCELLRNARRDFDRRRTPWGTWAKLTGEEPAKKSKGMAAPVQALAARHIGHPRLRAELHALVRDVFTAAASGLRAYQKLKKEQGLLDFVDQEVLALRLLKDDGVRERLRGEIDLVLVDEFQDTSPLQLAIFLKLAELAPESVWVGDPKQAIYAFRGADPALMDAAIESLSNPTRDGDLVAAAVDAVARTSPVETLSRSYRSRPALVSLTNEIFVQAFSRQQGMPEERVRISPDRNESSDLGPAVTHWRLTVPSPGNKDTIAQALATGTRDLVLAPPTIWDRHTRSYRKAVASDVAILCRTNQQCSDVSEALGQLGVASLVARVGLLDSAEAQLLIAALQLWVDPRDRLAAATVVRILEHADDPVAFLETALDAVDRERFASSPFVQAILIAREKAPDFDVPAVIDAIVDALDLRRLCAEWGSQVQRTANLDALRAHAVSHCDERAVSGEAATLVGFLSHLQELAEPSGWGDLRSDTIARVTTENAVTVSTRHAAKGLEWPIVILYGLETIREPDAYGVHVLTDRSAFDVSDPLGGRRIHFWPNPYATSNQKGPVKDAYAGSSAHQQVSRQAEREALRVLYVGWTRARDQLILAAHSGKMLKGILSTLTTIDAGLINEPTLSPTGFADVSWAGQNISVATSSFSPAEPVAPSADPGSVRIGRPLAEHPPATLAPSSAPLRPGVLGIPERLGDPVRIRATVEIDALGSAVHFAIAADDPKDPPMIRLQRISGVLEHHGVKGALAPTDVLSVADRLWEWVRRRYGKSCIIRPEWPLGSRLSTGTLVAGISDLVLENSAEIAIVDHKSYGVATATDKVESLAGQLGSYADAAALARPGKAITKWVHLPMDGVIVEVR